MDGEAAPRVPKAVPPNHPSLHLRAIPRLFTSISTSQFTPMTVPLASLERDHMEVESPERDHMEAASPERDLTVDGEDLVSLEREAPADGEDLASPERDHLVGGGEPPKNGTEMVS